MNQNNNNQANFTSIQEAQEKLKVIALQLQDPNLDDETFESLSSLYSFVDYYININQPNPTEEEYTADPTEEEKDAIYKTRFNNIKNTNNLTAVEKQKINNERIKSINGVDYSDEDKKELIEQNLLQKQPDLIKDEKSKIIKNRLAEYHFSNGDKETIISSDNFNRDVKNILARKDITEEEKYIITAMRVNQRQQIIQERLNDNTLPLAKIFGDAFMKQEEEGDIQVTQSQVKKIEEVQASSLSESKLAKAITEILPYSGKKQTSPNVFRDFIDTGDITFEKWRESKLVGGKQVDVTFISPVVFEEGRGFSIGDYVVNTHFKKEYLIKDSNIVLANAFKTKNGKYLLMEESNKELTINEIKNKFARANIKIEEKNDIEKLKIQNKDNKMLHLGVPTDTTGEHFFYIGLQVTGNENKIINILTYNSEGSYYDVCEAKVADIIKSLTNAGYKVESSIYTQGTQGLNNCGFHTVLAAQLSQKNGSLNITKELQEEYKDLKEKGVLARKEYVALNMLNKLDNFFDKKDVPNNSQLAIEPSKGSEIQTIKKESSNQQLALNNSNTNALPQAAEAQKLKYQLNINKFKGVLSKINKDNGNSNDDDKAKTRTIANDLENRKERAKKYCEISTAK